MDLLPNQLHQRASEKRRLQPLGTLCRSALSGMVLYQVGTRPQGFQKNNGERIRGNGIVWLIILMPLFIGCQIQPISPYKPDIVKVTGFNENVISYGKLTENTGVTIELEWR